MSSKGVELAEAIKDALNAAVEDDDNDFVLQFEAKRLTKALTQTELQNAKTVSVSVFTGTKRVEAYESRNHHKRIYKPIVTVQRLLTGEATQPNSELVDKLQELVEQIEAVLEFRDLVDLKFDGFDEGQDREAYNEEAMREMNYFASAITLEYTTG